MTCADCTTRGSCKRICPDVEYTLRKLNHSLKSRYLVLFCDPTIIEEVCAENKRAFLNDKSEKIDQLEAALLKCIEELNKRQKDCIIRYYGLHGFDAMSQPKIAIQLQVSQNTVKYHLQRGRRQLEISIKRLVNI